MEKNELNNDVGKDKRHNGDDSLDSGSKKPDMPNKDPNAPRHSSTIQDQMRSIKSLIIRLGNEQDTLERYKDCIDRALDDCVMFTYIVHVNTK